MQTGTCSQTHWKKDFIHKIMEGYITCKGGLTRWLCWKAFQLLPAILQKKANDTRYLEDNQYSLLGNPAILCHWPYLSRGWTKWSLESPSQLCENRVDLCLTWQLEWERLHSGTIWIKVNRFSSKQSNCSGSVNICNSRGYTYNFQSSTKCTLCGAWHNEDVALQTLLSVEGYVLQWLFSFLGGLKR